MSVSRRQKQITVSTCALVSCPKQPSALLFPFPQAWRGVANLQGAPPPSFALSRPARTFWTRRSLLITCKSVGRRLPFDGTMDLIGAESMPACVPCSKIRSFLISPSSFLTLPRAALRCPADARTRADRLLGDAGSYVTGLELGDAANDVSWEFKGARTRPRWSCELKPCQREGVVGSNCSLHGRCAGAIGGEGGLLGKVSLNSLYANGDRRSMVVLPAVVLRPSCHTHRQDEAFVPSCSG